ncbi:hypothetical protein [Streptomyces daliensis]|uniref:Cobyrinic acid a,c-diamide synthase n=1 Tax=Streptomyces daliensis TaxID=299421 RepID=A0A8T4IH22_9ACTN|nr:hypothetical protein [Streptomyces daliensis]
MPEQPTPGHHQAATATGTAPTRHHAKGFTQGGVHASYLHVHWAATPELAHRFVRSC